ncbi:MAG: DoxX family protein [Bacteroidetes bacterium]|nr:DoxX family protein [Bacteroidota bacterium]
MRDPNKFLESKKDFGILIIRLIFGYRLIEGMVTVISNKQIHGLAGFFSDNHIPFPLFSAYSAVCAELICGILFIIGLWARQAALIMVFTFTVAIVFIDIYAGFEKAFPAWSIWAISIFILLNGAGKISLDEKFNRRK